MKKVYTLCLIHQPPRILLGMKKRGLGMGRWNGFGGKVQAGEEIEEAARRELFEEAGIDGKNLVRVAVNEFSSPRWPNDVLEVHVFRANNFSGEPSESDEMKPQWFPDKEIPFDQMWPSDRYWFPLFLAGKKFRGKFTFDEKDQVIKHEMLSFEEL